MKTITIDYSERARLLDLLRDQLDETVSGSRTGYGQPVEDEAAEIKALVEKLED